MASEGPIFLEHPTYSGPNPFGTIESGAWDRAVSAARIVRLKMATQSTGWHVAVFTFSPARSPARRLTAAGRNANRPKRIRRLSDLRLQTRYRSLKSASRMSPTGSTQHRTLTSSTHPIHSLTHKNLITQWLQLSLSFQHFLSL